MHVKQTFYPHDWYVIRNPVVQFEPKTIMLKQFTLEEITLAEFYGTSSNHHSLTIYT